MVIAPPPNAHLARALNFFNPSRLVPTSSGVYRTYTITTPDRLCWPPGLGSHVAVCGPPGFADDKLDFGEDGGLLYFPPLFDYKINVWDWPIGQHATQTPGLSTPVTAPQIFSKVPFAYANHQNPPPPPSA